MSIISNNPVKQHAQHLGLYAINKFMQTEINSHELKNIPADTMLRALLLPEILMWSIEIGVRQSNGNLNSDFIKQGTHCLFKADLKLRAASYNHPAFITSKGNLEATLNDMKGEIEADEQRLISAWHKGIEVLGTVCPRLFGVVNDSVFLFLGINNKWGEIEAFSSPKSPGFIAIGINNPPILLAEEILHEAIHVYLWALLAERQDISDIWAKIPPVYSPFSRSPRPAVRVLHGIASYYAVLCFWESVAQNEKNYEWFGNNFTDEQWCKKIIHSRIGTLTARLSDAFFVLRQATKHSDILVQKSMTFLDKNIDFSRFSHPSNYSRLNNIAKILPNVVNPIERAEILLAIHGNKVSRVSVPFRIASLIGENLIGKAPVLFSESVFCSKQDVNLGGFSNTIQSEKNILNADLKDEIFCYIGRDAQSVQVAQKMDVKNMAGHFYEIPECCQIFFRMNWDKIRSCHCGDSFGFLLQKNDNGILIADKNCNAAAMYFGGGLCWHFPCNLRCKATSKLISERKRIMDTIDKSLSLEISTHQKFPLLYGSNTGYGRLPIDGGRYSHMNDVQWLGNYKGYKDTSVWKWLHEKNIAETRLLIHFF